MFAQAVVISILTHSPPNLLLQGILLVYDVSDKKSFKAVERWLTCVREVRQLASWQLCDDDLGATASLTREPLPHSIYRKLIVLLMSCLWATNVTWHDG